jgi:23S rRNA pseudouridine1911/1915/1917 synthase
MEKNDRVLPPRILYLDDCLAVVYKKIGEVCESDAEDKSLSLIENLRADLESLAGKKLPELETVHRIDQPVSGCVLLALDKPTLAILSRQFADGKIRKKYLAIVEKKAGVEIPSGGRLEHLIRFDRKHHKATALPREEIRNPDAEWKKAALEWALAGNGERYAFLTVTPETGRTHQIRAQLAAAGMTIKGDLKYGARRSDPLGGIRLHSYAIQFSHPISGDAITVVAPVQSPDNLWQAFGEALP